MSRPPEPPPGEAQKYIYALADPRTLQVRYVGQSTDPLKRLSLHMAPRSLKVENARNRWLRELIALHLRPVCIILQTPPPERWADAERAWIVQGRMIGWELVNTSDGGEGVLSVTPETYVAQAVERAGQRERRGKSRRKKPAAVLAPKAAKAGKGDSASLAPGPPPQKPGVKKELPPLPAGISRRPVERRQKR